jgi:signal transduction histidine kinase
MLKLRTQFFLFSILLVTVIATLLFFAYRQLDREEFRLWQGISENVYNQFQASVSDFLILEDGRSFSQYRYFYVPNSQIIQNYSLNISPLSKVPVKHKKGLLGYFQIDPSGKFSTPYLPPKNSKVILKDAKQRNVLHNQLNVLTESFQDDVKNNFAGLVNPKPKPKVEDLFDQTKDKISNFGVPQGVTNPYLATNSQNNSLELTQDVSTEPVKTKTKKQRGKWIRNKKSRKSYYPNPIQSKSNSKDEGYSGGSGIKSPNQNTAEDKSDDEHVGAIADEEENSVDDDETGITSKAQYQTFKDQKILGVEDRTTSLLPDIFIDPFRARLVDQKYLIFYRKVWLEKKIYIQGFVVELSSFYTWLMGLSFDNSRLPEFASSKLKLGGDLMAHYGLRTGIGSSLLFKRHLGYPLNQFNWHIEYRFLPNLTNRSLLHSLTILLFGLATIGLYIIYRSTNKEVILSKKRQDFVSAITHELKTPLTSIRMYSEMLTSGWAKDEGKKQEYYELISKESDRLSRLIENVLQLARLEKKSYRYNLVSGYPTSDFQEFEKEFKPWVESQGFTWKSSCADNLPEITCDQDVLKQIFITLIDNALKFSKDAKEKCIEMHLKQSGDHVIWSLADHGPGVAKKELQKIFTQFYRVENEMTRQTKGTGIGLSMVKMFTDGMGAKLEATNRKNGGLEIRLIFPTI